MRVYLSVCCDRHQDDEINVHRTPEGALKKIKDFVKSYNRYEFETNECGFPNPRSSSIGEWIQYIHCTSSDDGPSAHVEVQELKE